jgi:hypothetical protein
VSHVYQPLGYLGVQRRNALRSGRFLQREGPERGRWKAISAGRADATKGEILSPRIAMMGEDQVAKFSCFAVMSISFVALQISFFNFFNWP